MSNIQILLCILVFYNSKGLNKRRHHTATLFGGLSDDFNSCESVFNNALYISLYSVSNASMSMNSLSKATSTKYKISLYMLE